MKYFWIILTMQVMIVFLVAIFMSFIPDYFSVFFGDHTIITSSGDRSWVWGWRHYLWCFMGVMMFIIQCFRIGFFINNKVQSTREL